MRSNNEGTIDIPKPVGGFKGASSTAVFPHDIWKNLLEEDS